MLDLYENHPAKETSVRPTRDPESLVMLHAKAAERAADSYQMKLRIVKKGAWFRREKTIHSHLLVVINTPMEEEAEYPTWYVETEDQMIPFCSKTGMQRTIGKKRYHINLREVESMRRRLDDWEVFVSGKVLSKVGSVCHGHWIPQTTNASEAIKKVIPVEDSEPAYECRGRVEVADGY